MELCLSEDNYLLSKQVSASSLQRVVDWKALGITAESIKQQKDLIADRALNYAGTGPEDDSVDAQDRFNLQEMFKYSMPREDDVIVWYDDDGDIGSAGYLWIRDGYVYKRNIVIGYYEIS